MIYQYKSYRDFLKNYIAQKIAEAPQLSLRTMAKKLEITQPFLTEVIKGRKNLSPAMAHKLAQKLHLNTDEAEYFCLLAQIESTKDPGLKGILIDRLQKFSSSTHQYEDLSVEAFRLVANWYHLAIRSMTELENFNFEPREIAKRLGISAIEAEAAIERLLRLELIEADTKSPQKFRKIKDYVLVKSQIPNQALRQFHKQMLEKAIESIESQTPDEKIIGTETFAFAPKYLEEAHRLTEEYFKKMSKLSSKPGPKTEVYHLAVQFFNLTKGRK